MDLEEFKKQRSQIVKALGGEEIIMDKVNNNKLNEVEKILLEKLKSLDEIIEEENNERIAMKQDINEESLTLLD